MDQSFSYNGPKSPTEDRDCGICATVVRKKCPIPEHTSPVVGCSHCDAVRTGFCPSHCGIELAVGAANLDPKVAEFVLAESAKLPEGSLRVHVRSHDADPDLSPEFGLSVEISLRPS